MKNHIRKVLALLLILSMMMGITSASEIDGITEESLPQNQVINEDATVSEESSADHQQDETDMPMDEPATEDATEGELSNDEEQEDIAETDTSSEPEQETAADSAVDADTETDADGDADADASEEQFDFSCFDLSAVALSALSDDCAHDELYVYEDTSEWSYEIIDEDTHRLTYTILSRRLTCESCGKILQVVNVNKPFTRIEEHDWCSVSDTPYRVKCLDCEAIKDFEKLCDHERTQMYEDGNLYCMDCGKVIVLNPDQTYCQHQNYSIYDAKNPYIECWYRSIDEKQHLKMTEVYTFSGSDGFGICKDCGIWLGLTDGKIDAVGITDYGGEYDEAGHKTVVEEHSFVNGACSACGQAENTCSHSATVTAENKEKTTSRVEMIEGDTEHHKVITTKHMDLFCADCGTLVAEGETVEEERIEAHTPYWGGACSVCGIGSGCQHANAVERKYTGDSWTDYVWTGKGNQHYRIVYRVTRDCIYCYECERVGILNAQGTVSGNYVSPDFVRSEIARNVEYCYLVSNMGGEHCDYCFHYTSEPDIETPTKPTVTITYPANNATVSPDQDLKVAWDGTLLGYEGEDNCTDYEYVFCHVIVTEANLHFDQGAVFTVYSGKNEYTIPAGTMEAGKNYKIYITFGNQSDYYADIGATVSVQATGTATECDHSTGQYNDVLDESVKPVYSNITETTHCVQYSYKRYCKDCGAYIKNVLTEGYPPVEHEFGEGDTCDCGYTRVEDICDHSAGHYNDVLDESVKPVYSNITETTHCVQYSYKRYCKDCGAYIKNVLSEGYPPVEHEFGDGDACDCGYIRVEEICNHSAGHYNDVLDESVKPVYSNITETTHCVQYSYKRYCVDCGAYIKNVIDEGITPVAHDFSNGDICECGYVKIHEHIWTVKDDSEVNVHPHPYIRECSVCFITETAYAKYPYCCGCGGNSHSWYSKPTVGTGHYISKHCRVCGQTETKTHDYDSACVICNANCFEWEGLSNNQRITLGKEYIKYRNSDEFIKKYCYAPEGGLWYSDASTWHDGISTMARVASHADYYALYVTPEDVQVLAQFMNDRTHDVALNTLKSWTADLIGEVFEVEKWDDKAFKEIQVADIVADTDVNLSEKYNISIEKLEELEFLLIAAKERDTSSLFGKTSEVSLTLSDEILDSRNSIYTEFTGKVKGFVNTVGKLLLWYDFLTAVEYAATSYELQALAENNQGMIITKQVVWQPYFGTEVYRPVPQQITSIKEWDCSEGRYMDNDFDLYGSYEAF